MRFEDVRAATDAHCLEMMRCAQAEGLLDRATDLSRTRQVYDATSEDADTLATLILDSIVHGGGCPRR